MTEQTLLEKRIFLQMKAINFEMKQYFNNLSDKMLPRREHVLCLYYFGQ